MRKLLFACALVPALAGCETAQAPTGPTTLESHTATGVTVESPVQAQHTTFSFCPTVTPFNANIGVIVAAGDIDVLVTSITSQFTDVNNIRMPMVTLPAPIPIAQFGTRLFTHGRRRRSPSTSGSDVALRAQEPC